MKIFKNRAIRWLLLTIGLCSIIILTGMNVYSLYNLRDKMVENEEVRRLEQIQDITMGVSQQLLAPFRGFSQLDFNYVPQSMEETNRFPERLMEKVVNAHNSPIYDRIYFSFQDMDPCTEGTSIYQYDPEANRFELTDDYPDLVCDGVGTAQSRARTQLNGFEYRWKYVFEYETHRSINFALLNLDENEIIGTITVEMNKDYIINDLLTTRLRESFGSLDETGTVVWLRDWVQDEILTSSDPTVEYNRELVDDREFFPNYFDNWSLMIAFMDQPLQQAYTNSLIKNLVVLGVAVIFVFGALIFMFVTAQKERELSQRQAGFIANVTHELKTPLAVMQAAGENIQDGRVTEPERLQSYGKHIYNESIRLRSMIEKLLDVAKVDSGQAVVKPVEVSLNELTQKFLNDNESYLQDKGFEVECELADKEPICLIDPDSFETVINNLTENAVKYSSEKKHIRYEVFIKNGKAGVKVEDQGVGIPRGDLKNIFRKFYRVEDSLVAKTKGHGLGLSIVKNMVELNSGEIRVVSTVGKGSAFIVTFPLSRTESRPEHREQNQEQPLETV